MPYLRKALLLILLTLLAGAISGPSLSADRIVNGKTPDDDSDTQCSTADLNQYIEKIKKDIQAKWQPVKGFADRHVIVIFTIRSNGTIENAKIEQESGSQEADRAALEALKAASPLAPLPKGAPESIQIRYVFSWQVH